MLYEVGITEGVNGKNVVATAFFDDSRLRPDDLVAIVGNYDLRDKKQSGEVSFTEKLNDWVGSPAQAYDPDSVYIWLAAILANSSNVSNFEWQAIRNQQVLPTFKANFEEFTAELTSDLVASQVAGPLAGEIAARLGAGALVQIVVEKGGEKVIGEVLPGLLDGEDDIIRPGYRRDDSLNLTSLTYEGANEAISFYPTFLDLGYQSVFDPGILLSTGGGVGTSNEQTGRSVEHGTPGDSDLDEVISKVFPAAGDTLDAAAISFAFELDDPRIVGISLDVTFMSEEFPEFANSAFVDIAGVFVNGRNVAYFDDDPDRPLSVLQSNIDDGYFLDTRNGPQADLFETEFDGVSRNFTVVGDLQQGMNEVKIAIADTGDRRLDSAIYVSELRLLTTSGDGIYVKIDGSEAGGNLQGTTKSDYIFGLFAPDIILPGLGRDIIQTGDGPDVIGGTLVELDGDIVTDFSDADVIRFLGVLFDQDNLTVTTGSAILDIDVNEDGVSDSTITLQGDFEGAEFNVEVLGENTEITVEFAPEFNPVEGTSGSDNLVGTDGADAIRSYAGSYDKMFGDFGADQFIFGAEANNGVRERNVILDYEVGIDEIVLEDGASVASIRQTSSQVVIFLEGDRDAIYVRGDGVTDDNISIIGSTDDVFALV